MNRRFTAMRVVDEAGRARDVIEILDATYQREKRWVSDPAAQIPAPSLARDDISWFIAYADGRPAGVLRVLYDPPVAEYAAYGRRPIDPAVDIATLIARQPHRRDRPLRGTAALSRHGHGRRRADARGDRRGGGARLHALHHRRLRGRSAQPLRLPHARHRLPPGGDPRCRRIELRPAGASRWSSTSRPPTRGCAGAATGSTAISPAAGTRRCTGGWRRSFKTASGRKKKPRASGPRSNCPASVGWSVPLRTKPRIERSGVSSVAPPLSAS